MASVDATKLPQLNFDCPFCGKDVKLGEFEVDGKMTPGVMHEVPYCRQFDELDPAEFTRACRVAMAPITVN